MTFARHFHRPFLAVIAVSTVLMAGCATQGPVGLDMEQRVLAARTEGDHLALAVAYDRQALADKQSAEAHARLAQSYARSWNPPAPFSHGTGRTTVGNTVMVGHCENLAQLYQRASKANEDLAAAHRQAAIEARK